MTKCVYCEAIATGEDALGLPACSKHTSEADEYFEERTGRKPSADPHEYCKSHCDMWEPGCPRCEECSQHHYGISVVEFLQSPVSRLVVVSGELTGIQASGKRPKSTMLADIARELREEVNDG